MFTRARCRRAINFWWRSSWTTRSSRRARISGNWGWWWHLSGFEGIEDRLRQLIHMRGLLAFLCLPALLPAAVATDLDPAECYRVREINIAKDEARFYFTDGYLIFAKATAGKRVAAVFSADVDGGDAEVLLLPPNRGNAVRWPRIPDLPISTSISLPP